MKNKILLFLILLSSISFAQVSNGGEQEFDYGIKNNASTEIATPPFLVSQGIDGTYGKMNRNNVIEYLEFASAVNLPVTGEQGKLYLTKDNNRLYRFNGTIYQEITTDISGKEDIDNKQNSLAVDGTNTKYPTVTAVNTGLALKANGSDVIHKTGDEIISLGTKTFNISQPIVGVQFNISETANGASAVAINNMNNGNAFYVDNKGGTAITVDLKNNSRGILMSDYSGGGQTNELFTAVKGSNTVYQLNSEGQVLGKSFVKSSTPATNILLAGGGDIAQNTAFNKPFGITAGTVAEGNYPPAKDGTGATGTWGINISGTAASSITWNGLQFVGDEQPIGAYSIGFGADGKFHYATAQAYKNWLGLGSNAYTSTAYLPIASPNSLNTWSSTNGFYGLHSSSVGMPSTSSYWSGIRTVLPNDPNYGLEITANIDQNELYFRRYVVNYESWQKLWHDGNFNPANYLPLSGGTLTGIVTATSYTATSLPVFENNAAASSLAVGQFYRTSTGVLMVKF